MTTRRTLALSALALTAAALIARAVHNRRDAREAEHWLAQSLINEATDITREAARRR
jgi:hypothetical protein